MEAFAIMFSISVIVLASLILNGFVCFMFIKKYWSLTCVNFFIANIAICDIIQTVLGFILEITFMYRRESRTLCTISTFMVFSMAVTVIMLCTVLSVIRCFALWRPFHYREWFVNKHILTYFCTFFCCALGFMWPTLAFTGWSTYVIALDHKRCTLDWKRHNTNSSSYLITVTLFCYVLPGIIIIISIILSKVKIVANTRKLTRTNLSRLGFKYFRTSDQQYLRFISTMCIILLLLWLPYAICSILIAFSYTPQAWILSATSIFAKLSTLANPIANCYVYDVFRKKLVESFKCKKKESNDVLMSETEIWEDDGYCVLRIVKNNSHR